MDNVGGCPAWVTTITTITQIQNLPRVLKSIVTHGIATYGIATYGIVTHLK